VRWTHRSRGGCQAEDGHILRCLSVDLQYTL
jgi:hypothetical protein